LETLRLRLPKIERGTSGEVVRRSIKMNAARRMIERANVPIVRADAQPQLVLLTNANTIRTRLAVRAMAPGISKPRLSSSDREGARMKKLARTTKDPMGTLT
jgi:hypothetical protein